VLPPPLTTVIQLLLLTAVQVHPLLVVTMINPVIFPPPLAVAGWDWLNGLT
jgi:hypothetical protein